jgi:DNA-binding transcriptional LysR family regulator
MSVQKFPDEAKARDPLMWDDVRFFLELARQEKLTVAARVLGVEHSTVARRVTALEHRLGVRLFDRLPRSWKLTGEGSLLVERARRVEEEALAFSRASMGAAALRGTVRVSGPPVLASHFLVPRLVESRHRWPGITIEMIGESRHANLYRREADLAIRLSRPEEPGLAARPMGHLGYGLYATAEWRERPWEQWEFIGYDESLCNTPQQEWLERIGASQPFVFRSNDLAALHQACRTGLGVAALPHFLARDDAALMALHHPSFDVEKPVKRTAWMATHPDVRRSPRVKAVAEIFIELFQKHATVLL